MATFGFRDYGYTSSSPLTCANDVFPEVLKLAGEVVGVDPSPSGIEIARRAHPRLRFEVLEADEHLPEQLGERDFDVVVSTEVIEHLYAPTMMLRGAFAALRPSGSLILSTPYHGYLKNLAISLAGGWDRHFQAGIVGGHIKFWSPRTLAEVIREVGFADLRMAGAGRLPWLWKSMVVSATRPA